MNEMPVVRKQVAETPVIRPKNFREDAFFNHAENLDFLLGQRLEAKIEHEITIDSPFSSHLLGVFVVAALIMVMGVASGVAGMAIAGGVFAFVGVVGVYLEHERAVEQRTTDVTQRLYTQGKILEGTVIECISSVEGGKYPKFYVDTLYRFVPPTGDPIQDHVKRARQDLSGTVLPAQGFPVYILYFDHTEYYLL